MKRKIALILLSISIIFNSTTFARSSTQSFAPLVERLMPAVVNVSTTQKSIAGTDISKMLPRDFPPGSPFEGLPELFEKFYNKREIGPGRKATSLGSGFVIDPEGYIVTNNHVIENAEEITVTFHDDRKYNAKVVGTDPKTDIALLKIDTDEELTYVKWGNSDDARVGDWVIAIGNPFGLGGSVSAGIISARARDINMGPFDDFIQTDAAINKGNSGGPLFDSKGQVIGVNSAIFSPSGGNVGIAFSVPERLVTPVIKQLKEHGRTFRGWLGVKIQTVTEDIAESLGLKKEIGALVLEVTTGSPADKGGIIPGDIILSFDGHEVSSMRKLPRIVAETDVGKAVKITVWRNSKEIPLTVKVAQLDEEDDKKYSQENQDNEKESKEVEIIGQSILDMQLANISSEVKKRYNLDNSITGVAIIGVKKDGSAAKKGLRAGDIIISVNQEKVSHLSDLQQAIEKAKKAKRKSVLLLVQHLGESQFVALPLE
ncbi:DegQ family serine endoprotease [Rickettsiales bacterium]|nr:DegQ family serine endoprotease [Rickettsiales bacterium]